jgi:hypothetical protein
MCGLLHPPVTSIASRVQYCRGHNSLFPLSRFHESLPPATMLYDLITIIGTPARFAARALLFLSYLLNGYATLNRWSNNRYARTRFGPNYMYRPWLLFDIAELKQIESLVNDGSDDDLLKLRDSQLGVSQLVAIVVRP